MRTVLIDPYTAEELLLTDTDVSAYQGQEVLLNEKHMQIVNILFRFTTSKNNVTSEKLIFLEEVAE